MFLIFFILSHTHVLPMFRRSHCVPPTNTNATKYISFTSAYIAYRDLELHRSSAASNSILVNGGATTTSTTSANNSELDSSKMREKLAALEDLNELLEEPVEEQVSLLLISVLVFFIGPPKQKFCS